MTIQPFTLGRVNSGEDPDAAQELFDSWLEGVIPHYLASPEYQALSKANKKAEGDWFDFFMGLYLGYFGGELKDVDPEAVREIMEELTPRKMICSDSQAKTIVPELIAFWSFLRREIGDKKLKNAAAIIDYLKSIKRDYLKIYRREPESSDFLQDSPTVEDLEEFLGSIQKGDLVFLDDEDDDQWVEHFIQDVAGQPADTEHLSDALYQLGDPEKMSELLEYICLGKVDESTPDRDDVIFSIFNCLFSDVFTHVRQGDSEIISFWNKMEQNIMRADEHDVFDPHASMILFMVLGEYREFLSPEFLAFIRNKKQDLISGMADENPPTQEDITQMLAAFFEEMPDEFVGASVLKEQFSLIAPHQLVIVFEAMLGSLGEQAADTLALWALDKEEGAGSGCRRCLVEACAFDHGQNPESTDPHSELANSAHADIC